MKKVQYFFDLLSPEEQEQFTENFKNYAMRNSKTHFGNIKNHLNWDFADFRHFIFTSLQYFDYNQKFVWREIAEREIATAEITNHHIKMVIDENVQNVRRVLSSIR